MTPADIDALVERLNGAGTLHYRRGPTCEGAEFIPDEDARLAAAALVELKERAEKAEADNAKLRERTAAMSTASEFAQAAIEDAIYTEDGDGLDGDLGQRIIHLLAESREDGTFDVRPFEGGPTPPLAIEGERRARQKAEADNAKLRERLEIDKHGVDGIQARDATIKLQDERIAKLETELYGIKEYREKNPLGGPAKVFDAMADCIRAGESFESVLREYGFCTAAELESARAACADVQAEPLTESNERLAADGRHKRAVAELVHLEQAYSNRHSPQHRAAALISAQGYIASVIDSAREGK